jgi:hypothetical protein
MSVVRLYCLSFDCIVSRSIVLSVARLYCLLFDCIVCRSIVLSVVRLYCLSFDCIVCRSTVLSVDRLYCLSFDCIVLTVSDFFFGIFKILTKLKDLNIFHSGMTFNGVFTTVPLRSIPEK